MPSGANDGRNGRSRGSPVLSLTERCAAAIARVAKAATLAGRNPADIRILGASKTRTPAEILEAHTAGIACFGENYVADLVAKTGQLPPLSWHFIGHLQRNKAKKLVGHIDLLHTLSSVRLADALERVLAPQKSLRVLIQVNVANEATKSGCSPTDARQLAAHVLSHCPNLDLAGFMTIPPANEDPLPHYTQLRHLRDDISRDVDKDLPELSMGMSGDLDAAIAAGATIVRLGTVLFGPRQ